MCPQVLCGGVDIVSCVLRYFVGVLMLCHVSSDTGQNTRPRIPGSSREAVLLVPGSHSGKQRVFVPKNGKQRQSNK